MSWAQREDICPMDLQKEFKAKHTGPLRTLKNTDVPSDQRRKPGLSYQRQRQNNEFLWCSDPVKSRLCCVHRRKGIWQSRTIMFTLHELHTSKPYRMVSELKLEDRGTIVTTGCQTSELKIQKDTLTMTDFQCPFANNPVGMFLRVNALWNQLNMMRKD